MSESVVFLAEVESAFPKAVRYFRLFLTEQYPAQAAGFDALPFPFQLGVYIAFFNSVSTDVDLYSNEEPALQDAVKEAFSVYNEYLFLDS